MENPFIFGEIVKQRHFVDREKELQNLIRDLADGQKLFLLSPRRFGKSSLVSLALLKLEKRHIRTVNITVSSYANYEQFLEKFAERVLVAGRPFHKAGPTIFLDKIAAEAWHEFIKIQFRNRRRKISEEALNRLVDAADLIPYDVQRIAHELWDYAELRNKAALDVPDVDAVVGELVRGQAEYFERLWEQLTSRQRAVLQALSQQGPADLHSQAGREQYRLGPASTVQKALQALDSQDIIDRYHGDYFFVDPLFANWIRRNIRA